jgi:DNA-binding FrmR family transcriptional regulator
MSLVCTYPLGYILDAGDPRRPDHVLPPVPPAGRLPRRREPGDTPTSADGRFAVIPQEVTVELPEETIADLTKRLRRAEGQVRGVQQMLAEGRDCRDTLTQLSAATKALEQVAFMLVAAGLTWCVSEPEKAAAEGYALSDVQKMFMKLA